MLLGLLALAVKLTVLLQLRAHPLLQPSGESDGAVFMRLAQRVLAGDWALGPDVYLVSPLYAYFLAGALAVSQGSLLFARTLQVLLGVAGVLLIADATRRLFGPRVAWLAGLLAIGTGVVAFNEVLILPSALDPFLAALALWSLVWAVQQWGSALGPFALAGLSAGLLCANRPNALGFAVVAILVVPLARRSARALAQAVALTMGLALVLAPLAVRNEVVAGEWALLTTQGGLDFFAGNNARSDGVRHVEPGVAPSIDNRAQEARHAAETATGRKLSAAGVSDHFYGLAWRWIEQEPRAALKLFLRKLLYTVNRAEPALNYGYEYYRRDEETLLRVLRVGPGLLVPLGLTGLAVGWLGRRRASAPAATMDRAGGRLAAAVPALFVLTYALGVAAFSVSSRARLPLLPALAIGAGLALDRLWSAVQDRNWRAVSVLVLAPAVLAVPAWWKTGLDEGVAEERTRLAEELVALGRVGEAEALVTRAATEHPRPGLLHYRVGRALQTIGRCDAAVPHFEKALALEPRQPAVELGMGQCLLAAGRAADALPHLSAAREAAPLSAGFDRARALLALGRREEAGDALAALPFPQDAAGAALAAQVALAAQRPDLAVRFLQQAVALSPGSAELHDRLGFAFAAAGALPEALTAFQSAVRLDPGRAASHVNLAVTLAESGRVEEARAEAQAALRIDPSNEKARGLLQAIAPKR